jgi:hypothetical protein
VAESHTLPLYPGVVFTALTDQQTHITRVVIDDGRGSKPVV